MEVSFLVKLSPYHPITLSGMARILQHGVYIERQFW